MTEATEHASVCVCVCVCVSVCIYIYTHIYTHIFFFRFLSIIIYYKILNIDICAISSTLWFICFIYSRGLTLQCFDHLMGRPNSLEKTLMLGKIEGRREGDDRGRVGWKASSTQWT